MLDDLTLARMWKAQQERDKVYPTKFKSTPKEFFVYLQEFIDKQCCIATRAAQLILADDPEYSSLEDMALGLATLVQAYLESDMPGIAEDMHKIVCTLFEKSINKKLDDFARRSLNLQ